MDDKRMGEIAWTIFVVEKVCALKPNEIRNGLKAFAERCGVNDNVVKKVIALALNEGYNLTINVPEAKDYSVMARSKVVLGYIAEEVMSDGVKFKPDSFEREIGRIAAETGLKNDEVKSFYKTLLEKAYSGAMR